MPRSTGPVRTYVLLHGAWHGAWCWQKLTPLLEARGAQVHTPTQTGLGERAHLLSPSVGLETFVDDLMQVLVDEDLWDVILVGHSFGGNAITAVADRCPERLRHLVYLDAVIPRSGQSAMSQLSLELQQARRQAAIESSGGLTMPVPDARAFGVSDPDDARWLSAHLTPHPIKTYEDALTLNHPPGHGVPTTYIAVTPDYGPTEKSRDYAKAQPDWNYLELAAGHDAMVTSPEALAEMLWAIE